MSWRSSDDGVFRQRQCIVNIDAKIAGIHGIGGKLTLLKEPGDRRAGWVAECRSVRRGCRPGRRRYRRCRTAPAIGGLRRNWTFAGSAARPGTTPGAAGPVALRPSAVATMARRHRMPARPCDSPTVQRFRQLAATIGRGARPGLRLRWPAARDRTGTGDRPSCQFCPCPA